MADADLYFAPCFDEPDREPGWYLIYPGDEGADDDLYVGPFDSFDGALRQSLEDRP